MACSGLTNSYHKALRLRGKIALAKPAFAWLLENPHPNGSATYYFPQIQKAVNSIVEAENRINDLMTKLALYGPDSSQVAGWLNYSYGNNCNAIATAESNISYAFGKPDGMSSFGVLRHTNGDPIPGQWEPPYDLRALAINVSSFNVDYMVAVADLNKYSEMAANGGQELMTNDQEPITEVDMATNGFNANNVESGGQDYTVDSAVLPPEPAVPVEPAPLPYDAYDPVPPIMEQQPVVAIPEEMMFYQEQKQVRDTGIVTMLPSGEATILPYYSELPAGSTLDPGTISEDEQLEIIQTLVDEEKAVQKTQAKVPIWVIALIGAAILLKPRKRV
jgi:hypothetical protein